MIGRKTAAMVGVVTMFFVGGCGLFRPKPPFPMSLCLKASPELQWYDGAAHTLYVRVFPLTAIDGFVSTDVSDLLADPPPTIVGSAGVPQSRMLHPSSSERLSFDPPKDRFFTQFGVVAGYYQPQGRLKLVLDVESIKGEECHAIEFGPGGIQGGDVRKEDKKE